MPVANQKAEKTWRFLEIREGEAVFGCKFPECKYEHHDPGGIHLHYMKKHGSNPGRESASAGTNRKAQRQENGAMRTPQQTTHRHSWRLLKPSDPVERRAIEAGNSEVCETCEDVR